MWNLKRNDTNKLTKKDSTELENKLGLVAELRGRDSQGVWDGHVHTAIFKMDSQPGSERFCLNVEIH